MKIYFADWLRFVLAALYLAGMVLIIFKITGNNWDVHTSAYSRYLVITPFGIYAVIKSIVKIFWLIKYRKEKYV